MSIKKNFIIAGIFIPFFLSTTLANEHKHIKLGTHKMPNEIRWHCPNMLNHCRDETRTFKKKVSVDFTYPSNRTITRHLAQCAAFGAAAGLLSAGTSFEPAFRICMLDRIKNNLYKRIDIKVNIENERGCWRTHKC